MEVGTLTRRFAAHRLVAHGRVRAAAPWAGPVVFAATFSVFLWRDGVPASRERLLIWILLGLLALSTTNVMGWARGVVVDWLPFALVLGAYDLLRGQADGLLFSTHVRPQLEADRWLFFGEVPTVWLQDHLWHGSWDLRWWDYATWGVYMSYFFATYVLAAALWLHARDRFRRYVATVSLLALMGFVTYALFPAAPPWLASRQGELEGTARLVGRISSHVPYVSFEAVFERGAEYANPVAAVPSLHAAYTLLIALVLWRSSPWWVRPLLAAYPAAMTFALVYTAEHYVVDILLGWVYAALAFAVVQTLADRRLSGANG